MTDAGNLSSGLLISVVRNLKSVDRKDFAKQLEEAHVESNRKLDKLLSEHEDDVTKSVGVFRDVSKNIRVCREKIKSVQNSLQASHSLLQSRREELKKLWMENLEQKKICEILQQINEIKNLDRVVDGLIREQKFHDAVQRLKHADILLNGPLSAIEGLKQLRSKIHDLSQDILQTITDKLLQWLVVEAFDRQMLEIARNLSESTTIESDVCMRLFEKYTPGKTGSYALANINVILAKERSNQVQDQIVEALNALTVFDQLDTALRQLFTRSPSLCKSAVNDTVALLSLVSETNAATDVQPLQQLIQVLILQIRNSYSGHKILANELKNIQHSNELHDEVIERFWDSMQEVMETVVSDHIDIHPMQDGKSDHNTENKEKIKPLFRFANTASVAGGIIAKSHQPMSLICQPDPYNIIKIFCLLNRFCTEIETQTGQSPCKLNTFLHAFVMDIFIDRIKKDMDRKIDQALTGLDVWTALSHVHGHNMKILTSCIRIFELCEQIGQLIKNMESYTQRFASLWVLIMEEYTRTATEMYQRITHTRTVQGENMTEHSKISATWAVDEDISRLLKSLPSWTVIVNQTPAVELTPTGLLNLNESEQEIRQRTQRESEILISNLGVQREMDKYAVITDSEHIRSIICMHESLQWFCSNMHTLIVNIPRKAQEAMRCVVQIRSPGGEVVEQVLSDALASRLKSLESMSETCLLMMHLELRVHCFFHLLPLARSKPIVLQDDSDLEVMEFGRDLRQLHQLLSGHIAPNKVKYLFDGLGHLCASIFINSSQHMTKLPEAGQKRVCRNIFSVQRHLSQISARPEAELNRALFFYELVNRDPDELLALIMERGASFSYMEYTYLLSLAIRTNSILSSQPGVLEAKLKQLQEILSTTRR